MISCKIPFFEALHTTTKAPQRMASLDAKKLKIKVEYHSRHHQNPDNKDADIPMHSSM